MDKNEFDEYLKSEKYKIDEQKRVEQTILAHKYRIDTYMCLIDAWIRLEMESEKLPAKEKLKHMMQFKEIMINDFKSHNYHEVKPGYWKNITTKKYGPWASCAFDRLVKNEDGKIVRERPEVPEGMPKGMPNLSDL